ncbi:twinkle protein, mitochondrial [Copidosoma floridanum]|uniref:twinkle protein, mitochondrial n=1 Tax=Copidosoma floridanum TaxID=29053 RepID=UPI0006C93CFF|nr:twinkle protein, mitochondrial [Copidosoma floridanum]
MLARIFKKQSRFSEFLLSIKNPRYHLKERCYHSDNEQIPMVNLAEIKKILKSANSQILEGYACIVTNFDLCQDKNRKKDCKIHINKMTGFFICENCKRIGPWTGLENFLQPKKTKKHQEELLLVQKSMETLPDFSDEWKRIKKTAISIDNLSNDAYQNIVEKLGLEHVSQEVMSQMNILYEESTETLYFPLLAFRTLIVGYKSLCVKSGLIKTFPETNAAGIIIYKQKNIKSDGIAVLVPNIEDLLAVASEKAANLIICLPYGLQHIPQQILPSLEIYKKLILWFGNDEPSWDTARHFAKKLDEKRCDFVRPIDQQPRPKIAANLGYDLKEIIQNAQPIWHQSITTFQSLRQDVLSDLQNIDKVQGVKWTRYPALNKILKGFRRGEFTVLTGPTGCGKTTFMSEYSLDLAMQGVNTLWGSFEIRNARLAKTMLQQMAGVPLDENLENFDSYADKFEKLPIYFMTFHGQQSIKVVMEAVEHATYVHDIAHVIIDNVQFMMGMSDEPKFMDRFWKQDKIISAFRTFATKFNCHVSLVIHPRKEKEDGDLTTASIFGGAKASQEADNVFIVQDKRLTSARGKKFLQVAKNRYSGDLGIMLLEFDRSSLSYAQKKKSKPDSEVKVELFV